MPTPRAFMLLAAGLATFAYLSWSELRIQGLQRITDLVYDSQGCVRVGEGRAEIRKCFEAKGFDIRPFDATSDLVDPKPPLHGVTFRQDFLIIEYDARGLVVTSRLDSIILYF